VGQQGRQSCEADGSRYGLLLGADRARSLVEHVLDVRTEDARSLVIRPGNSDQLHHAQAVWISRQPAFVGEIPEAAEDARPGLRTEKAEIVEREVENARSLQYH